MTGALPPDGPDPDGADPGAGDTAGTVPDGGPGVDPVRDRDPGVGAVRLEPTEVLSRVARRRRAQRPVPGRTSALVAVAAVVLGVGIVSALVPPPAPATAPAPSDGVSVAPVDARTSSFFCTTGAGADAGSGAAPTIVVTNSTDAVATGVETAVAASGGVPVRTSVVVPADGTVAVDPAAGLPSGASAATFAFVGGGVTGTAVVSGPQGWSTAPCATQVSPQWDFAGGSTTSGLLDLSLYDPTAAPTVVDVTFLTAGGTVLDPQAYQGLSLAPGEVTVETLGAYVQQQPVVATLVEATSGALVATELDQLAVPSGSGLALLAGTPGPSATWRFAQTAVVAGGRVVVDIANPGAGPVTAEVSAALPGAMVVPHRVAVPARTVLPYAVSSVAGWPLGSSYSLTVTASAPVVVGRVVVAPSGTPVPQAGLVGGTTVSSTTWLVVAPGAPGHPAAPRATLVRVAVQDPGPAPVDVTVRRLGGGATVATATVPGGGVTVFGYAVVGGLRPLVVAATGPVDVLMDGAPAGAPGIVSWPGFALGS